jgi:lipopolysaccharide/colanic/teichoic acid biosynthesis glycosyltransferase
MNNNSYMTKAGTLTAVGEASGVRGIINGGRSVSPRAGTSGSRMEGMGNAESGQGVRTVGFPKWKRIFDAALIWLSLPFWLPFCLLVAVVIRLGSRGPVLFKQDRVGQGGSVFTCFKFRTMHLNANQGTHRHHVQDLIKSSAPMVKLDAADDDRLIRGGSWIRACGLDELPQLINILRGEMSIVGPRPCIPYEFDLYEPWQRDRFMAPPGLTGLWQVSGKNRTTFDEMVRLDMEYARRMSLWLDLKILFLTPVAIVQQVCDMRAAKKQLRKNGASGAVPVPRESNDGSTDKA